MGLNEKWLYNNKQTLFMNKIGVLITYYNEKQLLTDCLNSVLRQTVPPDEIIIYDDASQHPATHYLPQVWGVEKVRIVTGKANIGSSAARNRLMQEASSDYVRFLDADDLLQPTCVEVLKACFEAHPAEVYINEYTSIELETGKLLDETGLNITAIRTKNELVSYAIRGCLLNGTATFDRQLALRIGGFKGGQLVQAEDYEFYARLVEATASFHIITEPLMIQRCRDNSVSKNEEQGFLEGMKALQMLEFSMPPIYKHDIAVRASSNGKVLYKLGNHTAAKQAFDYARQLSPQVHQHEKLFYRLISTYFSQQHAEEVSGFYRQLFPVRFRIWLAGKFRK